MTLKTNLSTAYNEKDVENIYRAEILNTVNGSIVSPYGIDGLLKAQNIKSLLEFKFDEKLKNKLSQCNVLIQCLYYLKKFEIDGKHIPTTIFVGDINECFAIHTNSIVKYLSAEIDWKIAPSEAHKRNPDLIQAMVGDTNILPFIFDIDDDFKIRTIIEKIKDLTDSVIRKVRLTKHNISSIFDYFDKNVIGDKSKLTSNERANLFIQIVININENYIHPKKKNILITKSFGELNVNQNLFTSFFSHFEGELYSPKEKEGLTSLVDRLIEDSIRRSKGEFFSPTPFVDLAHKYISDTFGEDWKEKYVVWDCAWGTGNLTRDYKFKELYCSTLEQSDIDTANQMNYNPEATKFQYDFLNDSDDKLPVGLREAIESGKEIIFFINPPYARSSNSDLVSNVGVGIADTVMGDKMKSEKWGACSANLYAQFLYRITKLKEINKNINIGIFCKPNYLSSPSYEKFRVNFFNNFGFENGFLFQGSHFSDVATQWGINFAILSNKVNEENNNFTHDLIDFDKNYDLVKFNEKDIYNTDKLLNLSNWLMSSTNKSNKIDTPQLTSSLKVKNSTGDMISETSFGSFMNKMNSVYVNQTNVAIFTSSSSKGNGGVSMDSDNIDKCFITFSARKLIKGNWVNDKDEYLAPNEQHSDYEQFTIDSIVYSLFNNSSQQSSLRQVDYKDKKWDIKNEFFWLSKDEIQQLANDNSYDELYRDAKNGDERFVYNKLFVEGLYNRLSPDAKNVLDLATELLRKSIQMRKIVSENHPEYHLNSFDAGYAQLKLVWKEYFKDEFKTFRDSYKTLEDRMRPLVYELGFLRK